MSALQRDLDQLSNSLSTVLSVHRQHGNLETICQLQKIRTSLIHVLLDMPASAIEQYWLNGLAEIYNTLFSSGIRDFPRGSFEQIVANGIFVNFFESKTEFSAGLLLSLMIMYRNFETPILEIVDVIPSWIRPAYYMYIFENVSAHYGYKDADCFAKYLAQLTDYIHSLVVHNGKLKLDVLRREILREYSSRASYIQAYFCNDNLKVMYKQRGEILNLSLVLNGINTLAASAPRTAVNGRLRLGIFAQHFGPQTETYFTLSHFEKIDREHFEVYLYAVKNTQHPLQDTCSKLVDHFILLPSGIDRQIQRIREDLLDIFIISTNMTAVCNYASLLGATRLAPLQVASASSPVTTGATHIDALLTGEWNEPYDNASINYSEALIKMPGSVNIYAYQYDNEVATTVSTRLSLGIPDDAVVFFSGANYYKITPELSNLWFKILSLTPESYLVLMPFNPNWSSSYQYLPFVSRLKTQLAQFSLSSDRLKIVRPVPSRADVHKIISLSDIYLDSFPFSGACSLIDPVMVGIPMVVRSGSVGRSIHGASIMRLLDLEELICKNDDDYLELALKLANSSEYRENIRKVLSRHNASSPRPYLNTADFSQKVGYALKAMQAQQLEAIERFCSLPTYQQHNLLQQLADAALEKSIALRSMTDIGLVEQLIIPFFRSLASDSSSYHVVDVGACYGSMTVPLLQHGWTADLIEPDPAAFQTLTANMKDWSGVVSLHPLAICDTDHETIAFHKSSVDGLSGIGPSPFAEVKEMIEVKCMRLSEFYERNNLCVVDFLKIDAEGYDFEVLKTHDFFKLKPRLVFVEYGTHFPMQSIEDISACIDMMCLEGYGFVLFNCRQTGDFKKGDWKYENTHIIVNKNIPSSLSAAFGNILFYRYDDREFCSTLYFFLSDCSERNKLLLAN